MRVNPRLLTPALAGALIVTLLVGVWAAVRGSLAQARRLPDGTVLTLEAVTSGTQHSFVRGSWWRELLRPILLPVRQPDVIRAPSYPNYRKPALVFWLSRTDPLRNAAPLFWPPPLVNPWPEVLDESGYRIGPYYDSARGGIDGVIMTWLEVFPRRGKTVRIRLYERDRRIPVAEFAAPNPHPGPHPTWSPAPFPIMKQSGNLVLTLTGLKTGLKRRSFQAPAAPGEVPWTRADFRIAQDGHPTREWEPVGVTLSDATGNSMEAWETPLRKRDERLQLLFDRALSPDEPAWKLRVEFSRSPHARFAPDEAWIVRGLAAPRKDAVTRVYAVASRQGVKLTLFGIAGLGRISWEGEQARSLQVRPYVRIRATGLRRGQRVTLRAVDVRGREFAGYGSHIWYTESQQDLLFFLNLPPDSRRLDLTLAVHQSRFVEYLAKPSLPGR